VTRRPSTRRAGQRTAGRPRSADVDAAILRATAALLLEAGVEGTTINQVARRSGVARASIYLRYPSRDVLITAAIRAAIGRPPIEPSGDLERDLHRAAGQVRAVLSSRPFRQIFPRLVAGLLEPRDGHRSITYDMLAPNRSLLVDEYARLAETAGFRTDVPPELVIDGLIGPLINRMLVTGRPPTHEDAKLVVDLLIAGLRRRPPS
jgi:AcrR family transcriptional regulator